LGTQRLKGTARRGRAAIGDSSDTSINEACSGLGALKARRISYGRSGRSSLPRVVLLLSAV
jgi:hypothetical protein